MIELHHISKRFGPVPALTDVSLAIPPGQILGLLGENGAGKSTLMHILFGLIRPDSGSILADGRPVRIHSPRHAQSLAGGGIGMVHQHFKLVPTLTALENFALFLRQKITALRQQSTDWLTRLHWSVPLDQPVDSLAVGQQQRIEILKALLTINPATQDSRLKTQNSPTLILDEPTAVLTPQESSELFAAIRTLRDTGTAIVFITHKLTEVRQICDQIAILRRGKLVHTGPLAEIPSEQIAEKMVGSQITLPVRSTGVPARVPLAPALSLQNISTSQLKSLSLSIFPGEILGIAGVDGNGQSHLVQSILNTLAPPGLLSGQILLQNQNATHLSTRHRLDHIAFIAEDRQREALILPLSLQNNLMLKDYRKARFNTLGWLRFRSWRTHARQLIQAFDIRANSPSDPAASLSGGNQQKLVLARELHSSDKSIILAVNPTRGLDIGATAFVLQKLLDARNRPKDPAAILLIHSDLDELLAISDRISVLYNGTLTPTNWPNTTKEAIGKLMLGLPQNPIP